MTRYDARNVILGLRREQPFRRASLRALLVAVLASSCDSSLEHRLERRVEGELRRFPTSVVFNNYDAPGSRAFHPHLDALAPVKGIGVEIPDKTPRPDGVTACRKWGRWTYHYTVATSKVSPDGETHLHFTNDPPLGLEAEGEYKANNPDGPWSFWHPNGQLRAQGGFVNGSVEGPWTFWFDTGVVDATRSGVYAAGALVTPPSAEPNAR